MAMPEKNLRLDSKKRLTLGKLVPDEVSSYDVEIKENGVIVLYPKVEIPMEEYWLFKNKEALESVQRGLKDSDEGNTEELNEDFWEDV